MGWATFWAISPQTPLVALVEPLHFSVIEKVRKIFPAKEKKVY
jgi:hypothetical protein